MMTQVAVTSAPDELTLVSASRHYQMGHRSEAESICRRILRARPNDPDALHLLGCLTHGNPLIAAALITKALAIDPGVPAYHNSLGVALLALGKHDEAVASFRRALDLNPAFGAAQLNLGIGSLLQGKPNEAADGLRRAVEIEPSLADGSLTLGIALLAQGQADEASRRFQRAIETDPALADGPPNRDVGTGVRPESVISHSNLLFGLHYVPTYNREILFAAARAWGARQTKLVAGELGPYRNTPDPERTLRIGYVSGDFHRHPVGYFLEAVLQAHDKSRVEVFCYSNGQSVDDLTIRLRSVADHWRSLVGVDDREAVQTIRTDSIDILVDLTGHTGGHRLGVFARKPAPVQATWVGYFDTTGLATIDYILLDRFLCPPGDERFYVEQVVRLPEGYLCYAPQAPAVLTPLPALTHGYVTFGSFNKAPKITPRVIALWARILDALPTARLCLKDIGFDNAGVRAHYLAQFAAQGIGAERITLLGRTPYAEHEAAYGQIDLGLDPFPFNGGTTTVEALWAGVPVVTLAGDHFVSRMGVSHLSAVGLSELIAGTPAEYLATAVGLARDLPRLADLRASLAERMRGSICDGERFTRGLEAAYRAMWRTWCQPCHPEERSHGSE